MKIFFTIKGKEFIFYATTDQLLLLRKKLAAMRVELIKSGVKQENLPGYTITNLNAPKRFLVSAGITKTASSPISTTAENVLAANL